MADSQDLTLKTFPLGSYQTNCYVLSRPSGKAWIIDAGEEPGEMFDYIESAELHVEKIILTHAHVDHIAGLGEAMQRFPEAPVLIHESERDFPGDASLNLSIYIARPITAPDPTGVLKHGERLVLDGLEFKIRHTPGHSPGGITLYQAESAIALVGDTLFAGSIGRFDFPTSDGPRLIRSIHEELLTLPDDTQIFPGHGPSSTIAVERSSNPYLRDTDLIRAT